MPALHFQELDGFHHVHPIPPASDDAKGSLQFLHHYKMRLSYVREEQIANPEKEHYPIKM
ncbi:hypothetical protein PanWU01x14_321760 [Parasponia andersonii]|uniref:Uncharacterized protein n=1 Tax=Parasponia andersonii TaxID=3476 RepID=A0A2P5AL75_PARAD|nr:hypothetical protein PanWU01x14_321760 [Parasponia andersonii]